MNVTALLLIVLALCTLVVALGPFALQAWRARTPRRVVCPETGKPAAIAMDPFDAAFHHRLGTPELRLKRCSRWPARADCGQGCLVGLRNRFDR